MLKEEKRLLRRCIADKKKMYTNHELATYSTLLLSKLERHPLFAEARTILMYYSLPDEVQTHDFIEKWATVLAQSIVGVGLKNEIGRAHV